MSARRVCSVGESITEFLDSALARRGKPPGAHCWNAGAAEHRRSASSEVQ
ncbi:hypothetical protein WME73_10175 [Sorangium sp. So ce302]